MKIILHLSRFLTKNTAILWDWKLFSKINGNRKTSMLKYIGKKLTGKKYEKLCYFTKRRGTATRQIHSQVRSPAAAVLALQVHTHKAHQGKFKARRNLDKASGGRYG